MKNYNYELHIYTDSKRYYKSLYHIFEKLNKRVFFDNKINATIIILFYKSINEICEFLNIDFNVAKKHFISGRFFKFEINYIKVKVKILPNEMNCLIDYISENETYILDKYNIKLNSENRIKDIEFFFGYHAGSIEDLLSIHKKKYIKLLESKGVYDTYYHTNV